MAARKDFWSPAFSTTELSNLPSPTFIDCGSCARTILLFRPIGSFSFERTTGSTRPFHRVFSTPSHQHSRVHPRTPCTSVGMNFYCIHSSSPSTRHLPSTAVCGCYNSSPLSRRILCILELRTVQRFYGGTDTLCFQSQEKYIVLSSPAFRVDSSRAYLRCTSARKMHVPRNLEPPSRGRMNHPTSRTRGCTGLPRKVLRRDLNMLTYPNRRGPPLNLPYKTAICSMRKGFPQNDLRKSPVAPRGSQQSANEPSSA